MPNDSAAQAAMIPNDQAARDSLDQDRENSAIGEVVFLVAVLLAWTVLLATGMFIASQPYRNTLVMGDLRILDYAFAWFMAFVSYTFTNLAMLSGLASIAGAGARHVEAQLAGGERITNVRSLYASATLRGFFVYLIALSSLMVFVEHIFTNIATSADTYIRLAGAISLLSFMLGLNPEMFARFLERVARLLEDQAARTKS
jgi:hypothetical protein